jgi:allophanate hydrolase subunit 1
MKPDALSRPSPGPTSTDLEYAARINGLADVEAFIAAHSGAPWFVSMVGFVAGLPFMFQMVERERQLQVPKYLRPRTDTPSSPWAMAAASAASTRCAVRAATRCSASPRHRSTTRSRP